MDNFQKVTATLSNDGEEAMERASDITETAIENTRSSWKELRGQGQKVWGDTQQLVQQHPAKSVGIALLAGVLIGAAIMTLRNIE